MAPKAPKKKHFPCNGERPPLCMEEFEGAIQDRIMKNIHFMEELPELSFPSVADQNKVLGWVLKIIPKRDGDLECPECNTGMDFVNGKVRGKHGYTETWVCPKCRHVEMFDEDGNIIEEGE